MANSPSDASRCFDAALKALIVYVSAAIRAALKTALHRDPTDRRVAKHFAAFVVGGGLARLCNNLVEQEEEYLGKPHDRWSTDQIAAFCKRTANTFRSSARNAGHSRGRPSKPAGLMQPRASDAASSRSEARRQLNEQLFRFVDSYKKGRFARNEEYGPSPQKARAMIDEQLRAGHISPDDIDSAISDANAVGAYVEIAELDTKLKARLQKALSRRRRTTSRR